VQDNQGSGAGLLNPELSVFVNGLLVERLRAGYLVDDTVAAPDEAQPRALYVPNLSGKKVKIMSKKEASPLALSLLTAF
jgi:hypothetical protein